MSELAARLPHWLLFPSAVAAGTMVLLARELGGRVRAQVTAAVGVIVPFMGHLLSTSTLDLLSGTAAQLVRRVAIAAALGLARDGGSRSDDLGGAR